MPDEHDEIIVRQFAAEIEPSGDGRTLEMRVVPYGVKARVSDRPGEFYDEATTKGMLMDLAKAVQAGKVSAEYLAELSAKSKEVSGYDILEVMGRVA